MTTKEEKYLKLNNIAQIDKEYKIYICKNPHILVKGEFFNIMLCKYRSYIENNVHSKNNIYYEIEALNNTNIMDHYINLFDRLAQFKAQSRLKSLIFKGTEEALLNVIKENINLNIKDIKYIKKIEQKLDSSTPITHGNTNSVLKKKYDIDKIKIDDINTIFNEERNVNSKKKDLCALQNYHRDKELIDKDLKEYIAKCITKLSIESNKIQSSNLMTTSEKNNFTSWGTILAIRDALSEYVKEHPSKYFYYVLISLYTYIPPRRKCDYYKMYYSNNFKMIDSDKILWIDPSKTSLVPYESSEQQDIKNYFGEVGGKYYFKFNNQKTTKTYPEQVIEVPDILKDIILNYIKIANIKEGDSLLNMTESQLSFNISTIFRKYINKTISVNLLRHIYITDYFINRIQSETIHEQKVIALKMAHSKSLQEKYKKIDDENIMKTIQSLNKNVVFKKKEEKLPDEEKKKRKALANRKHKEKNKQTENKEEMAKIKAEQNKKYYDKKRAKLANITAKE